MADPQETGRLLESIKYYRSLPKVELHRHLEGSLRLDTMMEIAHAHGIEVASKSDLRTLVQVNKGEPYTFKNFLSKFDTIRRFYRSPEVVKRVTYEAVADAAADNVRYLELRFTPRALCAVQGYEIAEVMDWVIGQTQRASRDFDIMVRLIASVNRHESLEIAENVVACALERRSAGIIGLDLAGNEAQFSAKPFIGLFREAQQDGLALTLHAGEWGGANNVAQAVGDFDAGRIGHGVRVMDAPNVVAKARQREALFEVCLTSNYQSGVVTSLEDHPLQKMLGAGLIVTLNTDDPGISGITLSHEYRTACEDLGLSHQTLHGMILAAAQGAFLGSEEKAGLVASLKEELEP